MGDLTVSATQAFYALQSHLIDSGDADAWAATFTADGAFHSPTYPAPVLGRRDLSAFARRFTETARAAGEVHRHVVTNVVLHPGGAEEAQVSAYLQVIATDSGGDTRILRFTTVHDRLRREDGRWRVHRRDIARDAPQPPGRPLPAPTKGTDTMTPYEGTGPARVVDRPMEVVHPEMAGRTAVVTGAARGMGRAFTAALAARGVNVVAADINDVDMKAAAEEIARELAADPRADAPGRVAARRVDVVDPEQHEALARAAVEEFGSLDYWINNAGVFPYAPVGEITAEQMSSVLDVNVQGVLHGSQAAARHMGPGGAIVNMSSVSAVRVRRGRAAYCASKAAVAHLTESLAVELGDLGLRVNSIAPGFIDTEMTRWLQDDPEALAAALDRVPLHRVGSPEEVVGVLLFLLSDSSRYVTGHSIAVDGGSRHV